MKLFKLSRYDKVLAPILMALSVIASTMGVLLITQMIKLEDKFPISSITFGWILLTIGVLCLIYSIVIMVLAYKKFSKQ